jgi:chorismate synthase
MFPLIDAGVKEDMLLEVKEALGTGDTLGGSVECAALGVPAGLGEPIFRSMQGCISQIMYSLCDVYGKNSGWVLIFALCPVQGPTTVLSCRAEA